MRTLPEALVDAGKRGVALGHFNVADLVGFKAVVAAARELQVPVMVGVSEGERDFIGVREIAALVRAAREVYGIELYLNADHTHSIEKVEEAARAGFDEILFDPTPILADRYGASGSSKVLKENIELTKRAAATAKALAPGVVVEGEIGYIGSSSEIVAEVPPESLTLTTPEEAKRFVEATGVDVLAPAVGNMHGLLVSMVKGDVKKRLNIERIAAIKAAVARPLTLHGGSGTADEDFVAAIEAGVAIIHVSTELRVAWRRGVEEGLAAHPEEVAPYKLLPPAFDAIRAIVVRRLKLFNHLR